MYDICLHISFYRQYWPLMTNCQILMTSGVSMPLSEQSCWMSVMHACAWRMAESCRVCARLLYVLFMIISARILVGMYATGIPLCMMSLRFNFAGHVAFPRINNCQLHSVL